MPSRELDATDRRAIALQTGEPWLGDVLRNNKKGNNTSATRSTTSTQSRPPVDEIALNGGSDPAVTMAQAQKSQEPFEFTHKHVRPTLPEPQSQKTSQTPRAPQTKALRNPAGLAKALGLDPAALEEPSEKHETPLELDVRQRSTPRENATVADVLGTILTESGNAKLRFALQFKKQQAALSKRQSQVEMAHLNTTEQIEEEELASSNAGFWMDMASCFISSIQVVCGGALVASNVPGLNVAGYSMIATGATGLTAQVLKALGYNATVTGAVSLIASCIGLMTGTSAFALFQGQSRAQTLMSIATMGQSMFSALFTMRVAHAQGKVSEHKAAQEKLEGERVILSQQAQKETQAIAKRCALLDEAVGKAAAQFARDRSRVVMKTQAAAAAA